MVYITQWKTQWVSYNIENTPFANIDANKNVSVDWRETENKRTYKHTKLCDAIKSLVLQTEIEQFSSFYCMIACHVRDILIGGIFES